MLRYVQLFIFGSRVYILFSVTLFRECGFDSWDDDDFWKNLDIRLDLMGLTPQRIDDDEIVAIGGADWWSDNEAVDDERYMV